MNNFLGETGHNVYHFWSHSYGNGEGIQVETNSIAVSAFKSLHGILKKLSYVARSLWPCPIFYAHAV